MIDLYNTIHNLRDAAVRQSAKISVTHPSYSGISMLAKAYMHICDNIKRCYFKDDEHILTNIRYVARTAHKRSVIMRHYDRNDSELHNTIYETCLKIMRTDERTEQDMKDWVKDNFDQPIYEDQEQEVIDRTFLEFIHLDLHVISVHIRLSSRPRPANIGNNEWIKALIACMKKE